MNSAGKGFNYVYIIQAAEDPLRQAIGITPNLAFALAQHNEGKNPATARGRPWAVRLALAFRESAQAEQFEQYLRTSAGRAFAKRHF